MIKFHYAALFNDENKDAKLLKDGYLVFSFLGEKELEALHNYYHEMQKETPDRFYASSHSKDIVFRKSCSEFIKKTISQVLASALTNYKFLGGAFVVKPANGKGVLAPHQDWNLVNELEYRSYNLWIPLIDVDMQNGAMFVLKGSHRKINNSRGPGIPNPFTAIEQKVWSALAPVPMKAGEALLYDHALIHASTPNNSGDIRLGIVCGILPENASMQVHFYKNNHSVEVYAADSDFFLEKNPMNGPEGLNFIEERTLEFTSLTEKQFKSVFLNEIHQPKKNWLTKLKLGK